MDISYRVDGRGYRGELGSFAFVPPKDGFELFTVFLFHLLSSVAYGSQMSK